jgi:hypothetical protein
MPFEQGSSSSATETQPLLKDTPPSYHSVDDDDIEEPSSPTDSSPPLLNNFSRVDVAWILAGLWSAVFLGALGSNAMIILRRSQIVTDLMPSIITF